MATKILQIPGNITETVRYTEQNLTEEQKAQVRVNIGVDETNATGGTTIHFGYWPGEVDPSEVDTTYKVGDLFLVPYEDYVDAAGIYELTGFDTESDPGLVFPTCEKRYSLLPEDFRGYECLSEDSFYPTPSERLYFLGEWNSDVSCGYPIMVTYNDSLYVTDGKWSEGVSPEDEPESWVKLIRTTDYATNVNAGVVKVASGSGSCVMMDGGYLTTMRATEAHITNRGANYTDFLLKASHTNHIVKSALTDANRIVMTDEEKVVAQETLGVDKETLVNAVIADLPVYDGSVV